MPPGGKSFDAMHVPYTRNTASYQVSVMSVSSARYHAGEVENYNGEAAPEPDSTYSSTGSTLNNTGYNLGRAVNGYR